jgi:hypothetical protein
MTKTTINSLTKVIKQGISSQEMMKMRETIMMMTTLRKIFRRLKLKNKSRLLQVNVSLILEITDL